MPYDRVACFVVRRQLFFGFVHDLSFAFWANRDFLERFNEVSVFDLFTVVAGGDNCRFVRHVCKVSTR